MFFLLLCSVWNSKHVIYKRLLCSRERMLTENLNNLKKKEKTKSKPVSNEKLLTLGSSNSGTTSENLFKIADNQKCILSAKSAY